MAAPRDSSVGWLKGQVILPGESEYDDARAVWNGRFVRRPAVIARVADTDDVVRAIEFARTSALAVSVRGGSYNVAGTAVADDALVIDLTDMNEIRVDAPAKRAWVQPGVRTGDLLQALERHSLAVPVGRVSQVGVAGITLGGGIGALMGTYGLTIDNVVSFEVVTADGHALRAAADENPDLYWALRGGGGNFGVVTEFEFELHEQGTMLAGRVVHPATEAADLLRFYRRFVAAAPDELTVSAGLLHTPDGTPAVAVVPVCSGDDLGEGDDEPNVTWADEVWTPVHPHSTGIYVNTLGSDGQQFIRDAYGPNYDRLARIKAHYDPENFFRMNQNIEPAA